MIRPISQADVPSVVRMIHALASSHGDGHLVELTEDSLAKGLFAEHPAVFGHVVEVDGAVIGHALWHRTFSGWLGKPGIWLMELYVDPTYRGHGYGKALLKTLADLCVANDYGRIEWKVREINHHAIEFYNALGAKPRNGWTLYSLEDEALKALGS